LKQNLKYIFGILFFGTLLCSCSITKFIPEGERLYSGATLEFKTDSSTEDRKVLKSELISVLQPEPNSTLLGMYPGLFYYYKTRKENPGFINRWLYKQIGEEPVYQSDVKPFEVESILRNRLENNGFFYSNIASTFTETEHKASLSYSIATRTPYKMASFVVDTMPSPLYGAVKNVTRESNFRDQLRFDLSNMKSERQRIDTELKKKGYYNINPDFFIFEADTNRYKTKQFDLFLKLKAEVPKKATVPYQIKRINIYPGYDLNDTIAIAEERFNNKSYFQDSSFIKPKHLDRFITLNEGDFFDPKASKNTARRLSSIGAYKYINIQYREIDSALTDSLGILETNIFLSPLTNRALRAELQAVTKSNNFTGPNLALTYSNRNLFQGGEVLNISTNAGYETQFASGEDAGLNSIELGLKGEVIFPRVLFPFKIDDNFFKYSVPKTKTSLAFNYLSRSKLYKLLSGSSLFGYAWNSNRFITYEFNPIYVNYTKLVESSPEFDEILNENPFLQQSFDQQFISGMTFSFTYNGMVDSNKMNQYFLNTTVDIAGNSISLLGRDAGEGEPKEFIGLQYAQYAKADVDFRFHHNFGKNKSQTIATRFFAGYGLAYGNSEVLPYVKQYFSGGPYSVRAFRIRSLGPGTYSEQDDANSDGNFFDQTGNIRLEANVEYRFPLFSFFKGAVFADAGNVWNSVANPAFVDEEGNATDKFTSNFINELGMGTGVGLRIDVQGFVIRFDLAAPFNDPSLPEGTRLDFKFDEPVLNFAIGYSF
jgi:outer membrane protein assembly factor BamA